jgi:hypothetical protein
MRLGASLAVAAVAALLSCPALAAGEAAGTDTTAPQQQPPDLYELHAFAKRNGMDYNLI